ncbi:hypothetical protein ACWCPI_20775 [Streptomyces sp. NPDC001920]
MPPAAPPRPPAPDATPASPPPPLASARFPDVPPTAGQPDDGAGRGDSDGSGGSLPQEDTARPAPGGGIPPRPAERPSPSRRTGAPAETAAETTFRLRPVAGEPSARPVGRPTPAPGRPGALPRQSTASTQGSAAVPAARPGTAPAAFAPDPSLSWSAPMAPGGTPGAGRPLVSFGEPEGYDEQARPRPLGARSRPRIAMAAACVVLGIGLIGGAVTGSWLVGEPGDDGSRDTFAAAGGLWHSVPVDQLFPATVNGKGAGPGGADRTWTRVAVAPDTGCADAFDPLLRKALAPVGCRRLLRATYTDATQSHVTTVGLLFTKADATAMRQLDSRFTEEGLDRRTDLMPRPYAPKTGPAAGFGDEQRASWTVSVLTDAPVVVYAVSGWTDDRTVDEPEPAEEAMQSGATTSVAQAGLGHEARGLADRVERALRKNVGPSTEQSS